MFDLEQAITEWRQQMLAGGIQTPVPLDELENHLREDVEQLQRSGLNARRAFENAVQQIGPAPALKHEFNKGNSPRKRAVLIIAGLLIVAVGMAWVTPAVAYYRDHGVMTGENLGFLLLGITVTLTGLGLSVWNSFRRHKA